MICSPSSRTSFYLAVKPQVAFASLSSPAVMDIRRLRRRLLEINEHNKHAKVLLCFSPHSCSGKRQSRARRRLLEINVQNKHAKVLLCFCESSVKEIKINRINNERKRGERAKRIKKNNKKLVLIIIIAYFCTRIKNKS